MLYAINIIPQTALEITIWSDPCNRWITQDLRVHNGKDRFLSHEKYFDIVEALRKASCKTITLASF